MDGEKGGGRTGEHCGNGRSCARPCAYTFFAVVFYFVFLCFVLFCWHTKAVVAFSNVCPGKNLLYKKTKESVRTDLRLKWSCGLKRPTLRESGGGGQCAMTFFFLSLLADVFPFHTQNNSPAAFVPTARRSAPVRSPRSRSRRSARRSTSSTRMDPAPLTPRS